MAVLSMTPEYQRNPLPDPSPLSLLLQYGMLGYGAGMGKSRSGQGQRTSDPYGQSDMLFQEGLDFVQSQRVLESAYDITVNKIAQDALSQKQMTPIEYITRGPGAKEYNEFLSEYYTATDRMRVMKPYLEANKKFYTDFLTKSGPYGDYFPMYDETGLNIHTMGDLYGPTHPEAARPAMIGDYKTYMNATGIQMVNGAPEKWRWQLPNMNAFTDGLKNAMNEAKGKIEANLVKTGVIDVQQLTDKGAALVTYEKKYYMRDKDGKLYAVGAENEDAIRASYLKYISTLTPEQERAYNIYKTQYVTAKQAAYSPDKNNPSPFDFKGAGEEFDEQMATWSMDERRVRTAKDQQWQNVLNGLFRSEAELNQLTSYAIMQTEAVLDGMSQRMPTAFTIATESDPGEINPEIHPATVWNVGMTAMPTITRAMGVGNDIKVYNDPKTGQTMYVPTDMKDAPLAREVSPTGLGILVNPTQLYGVDPMSYNILVDFSKTNARLTGVTPHVLKTTSIGRGGFPQKVPVKDPQTGVETLVYPTSMYHVVNISVDEKDARNITFPTWLIREIEQSSGVTEEGSTDGAFGLRDAFGSLISKETWGPVIPGYSKQQEVQSTGEKVYQYTEMTDLTKLSPAAMKAFGISYNKKQDSYSFYSTMPVNSANMLNLSTTMPNEYSYRVAQAAMQNNPAPAPRSFVDEVIANSIDPPTPPNED